MLDDLRGKTDNYRIGMLIDVGKMLSAYNAELDRTADELEKLTDGGRSWAVELSQIGNTTSIKYDRLLGKAAVDAIVAALQQRQRVIRENIKNLIRFNKEDRTNGERWAEERGEVT